MNPFLKPLWRRAAGLPENEPEPPRMPSLPELRRSEWSDEFETLMRNRLVVGAFRYGLLHEQEPGQWDVVGFIRDRLQCYVDTGNLEYLVDVANGALVEFVKGAHPKRHFAAGDDNVKHVRRK